MLTVIVGGAFGDEGKGKIVSYIALKDDVDVAARAGVGTNAGHTVVYNGKTYRLRQVPSAFVNERTKLYIGAGVLVDPEIFIKEVNELNLKNRIWIDYNCTVIEEIHKIRDRSDSHLSKVVGTTGSGCGPALEDRVKRIAKTCKEIDFFKGFL